MLFKQEVNSLSNKYNEMISYPDIYDNFPHFLKLYKQEKLVVPKSNIFSVYIKFAFLLASFSEVLVLNFYSNHFYIAGILVSQRTYSIKCFLGITIQPKVGDFDGRN